MYRNILVPVDGSPTSLAGLDEAVKLARLTRGRLRVLNVVDEAPAAFAVDGFIPVSSDVTKSLKEHAEKLLAQARGVAERAGVEVDAVLVESLGVRLADHVLDQIRSWHADLIVIGTHGRRGVGRLLMGSDAEQVARTATVPVLLVRSPTVPASLEKVAA